jgi:hypothetical protein
METRKKGTGQILLHEPTHPGPRLAGLRSFAVSGFAWSDDFSVIVQWIETAFSPIPPFFKGKIFGNT